MSLFGFGTPSELTTPLGVMVKSATDSLLIGPDWTKNMEICDQVNLHRDNIEPAIKAIRRRLMDSDQQTVALSLTLLETCMKNCGPDFARRFDRSLMDEVVNIVVKDNKGIHNREEALRLIQQWGRAFEARRAVYPIFFDTFMNLKARGVSFPKEDENVTAGFETSSNATASVSASAQRSAFPMAPTNVPQPSGGSPAQEEDEFIRLQQDLSEVMEKVRLCREMLLVSPGIQQDEALKDVVGFLEACRDRLVDIIEAGTQGLLGEELFEFILKVNDAVARTLESERTGVRIPVDDEESEGQKSGASSSMDVSLIDLSPSTPPPQAHFTIDEDLFVEKAPAPVVPAPYSGVHMSAPVPASSTTLLEDYVAVPPPPPPARDFSSRPLPPIDDFDALFGGTPASGSAAPINNSAAKESELEDFFASLDVQK